MKGTMKSLWVRMLSVVVAGLLVAPPFVGADKGRSLKITHSPVSWAIKGQPLTLRARVSGGAGGVESVTLYYALFRDAAPFRVNMAASGMDMYVGTIEAGLLSGLTTISYYIEAQDRDGSIEETPWYDVQFRDPDASTPAPVKGGGAVAATGGGKASKEEGMSAATIGLIAGGAVALGAGAYFLADSGGSSSGGGGSVTNDPGGIGNKPGTYSGNSTICRTLEGGSPVCESNPASVVIGSNGRVFSDSLRSGVPLAASLRGNDFTLTDEIATPELTGTITFSGTVLNENRIVGSVSGNFVQGGTNGTFSGTFNLSK